MSKFLTEFREFITKGNVLDTAVGIVIGAAFKGIIDSLVNDVIMPPIGLLIGGVDFAKLKVVLQQGVGAEGAADYVPEVAINYGMFINAIISFIIIALVIFSLIKTINKLRERFEKEKEAEVEEASEEVKLLAEILEEMRRENGTVVSEEDAKEIE